MSDDTDDLGIDYAQVRQVKKDIASEHALFNTMREPAGRQVLFEIMHEVSGLNVQSFAGENPLTTAYRAGKREVALHLLNRMLKLDRGLVRLMEDEAVVRAEAQKGRK